MHQSTGRAIAITLAAIAIATAIGVTAYNAGAARASSESERSFNVPPNAQVIYVRPWGHWGQGYGFLPFFPILFLLLFVGLGRRLFWGGRYGWHHHGCYYREHDKPQHEAPPQQV